MGRKIRWGILATGSIAETFARDLKLSHHGILASVASRSPARLSFCGASAQTAEENRGK